MVNKKLAKEILLRLTKRTYLGHCNDVLENLELIYYKIDIGDRYGYKIKHGNELIPLIAFRIDLDTPDVSINTNIIQILKNGKISDMYYQNIFEYEIVENIISKYRLSKIESIID